MFSCERNDADGILLTERDVQLLFFDLPQSCICRKSDDRAVRLRFRVVYSY